MVVFTCNNCGDSLQRRAIEKHYATVCKTSKNLTCGECLKNFRDVAYVAHTKCITDSAKSSVTNVIRKGKTEQQKWIDMMNKFIQNSSNVTGPQKMIFQIISSQIVNVPRKKWKFVKFIKNSGGKNIAYGHIKQVWDLIERHKSEHAIFTEGSNATSEVVSKPSEKDKTNNDKIEVPVNAENVVPSKRKKKCKSKHSESNIISDKIELQEKSIDKKKRNIATDVTIDNGSPQLNGNEEKKSKKRSNVQEGENAAGDNKMSAEKKSKKRKSDVQEIKNAAGDNEQSVSNLNGTNTAKKKKKSEGGFDNMTATNSVNQNASLNDSISKEKRKKKNKLQVDQESTDVEMKMTKLDDTFTTDILPKVADANKSFSKRKSETSQEITNVPVVEDAEVKVNKNDSNATDDLSRIILKVLQKKNILPLIKLQKKVIGEYCKEANITESPKLIKLFNKQLKKVKGVGVEDNNVILKTDEC